MFFFSLIVSFFYLFILCIFNFFYFFLSNPKKTFESSFLFSKKITQKITNKKLKQGSKNEMFAAWREQKSNFWNDNFLYVYYMREVEEG